jgi:hypothetical protein
MKHCLNLVCRSIGENLALRYQPTQIPWFQLTIPDSSWKSKFISYILPVGDIWSCVTRHCNYLTSIGVTYKFILVFLHTVTRGDSSVLTSSVMLLLWFIAN